MTTETPTAPAPGSVRALIGELARIEDAVRQTETYASASKNGTDPQLNPQLLVLFERQAEIVAALRRAPRGRPASGPRGDH